MVYNICLSLTSFTYYGNLYVHYITANGNYFHSFLWTSNIPFCTHTSFFVNLLFNWRKIALQCCIDFCVQQRALAIIMHIYLLLEFLAPSPIPPFWHHRAPVMSFLCYIVTSQQLSVLHYSVYMLMLFSPFFPLFPSPTVSASLYSTSVFILSQQIGSSIPFF